MPPRAKRALEAGGDGNASASKSKKTTRDDSSASKKNQDISNDNNDNNNNNDEDEGDEQNSATGTPDAAEDEDPYEYVTICQPRADMEAENAAKDAKDRLSPKELAEKNRCGGSPSCMCDKDIAEHPDWKWIIMRNGRKGVIDQQVYANYRDPDAFGMYTFNDHFGYGLAEMVENLLLDFSKAKGPKEQWVIVEVLAHWMSSDDIDAFNHIDDCERVAATINVVGTAFLAALKTLDRNDLLKPDSEIKDIPLIMGLFLEVADMFADAMDSGEEQKWPQYIVSYAKEKGIKIEEGPFGIQASIDKADTGAKLPTRSGKAAEDRFNFKKALKQLEQNHGAASGFRAKVKLGGHDYDITKWTRAERKKHAFDNKDPLSDEIIKALKEGCDIMLG